VKDRAFSGRDVDEALAAAAQDLGLPAGSIRYVVLDKGSPGGLGVKPSPARIAVLLDASAPAPAPAARPVPVDTAPAPAGDPRAEVRALLRAVSDAAALDVGVELAEREGTLEVRLSGPDAPFFVGADGEGAVLRALEHLLQRVYATAGGEEPLRLECEGFREQREKRLAETALALAAAVREDGVPRTTAPLNAYERRLVHVALSGAAGIVTYSVGEGSGRRVTVAPAPPERPVDGE
jgi:spoIIIJ-associated protein